MYADLLIGLDTPACAFQTPLWRHDNSLHKCAELSIYSIYYLQYLLFRDPQICATGSGDVLIKGRVH